MSRGFMISLCVIAILAYVLLSPAIISDPAVPREKAEIRALKQAMDQFKAVYSYYPTGELDAVVAALSGENPRKEIFLDWPRAPGDRGNKAVDPWGTPYRIRVTATGVTVTCAGRDKKFGTADDRSTD